MDVSFITTKIAIVTRKYVCNTTMLQLVYKFYGSVNVFLFRIVNAGGQNKDGMCYINLNKKKQNA